MSQPVYKTARRNSKCRLQCIMDGQDCRENRDDPNSCRSRQLKCQETRHPFECQREQGACNAICDAAERTCESECPDIPSPNRRARSLMYQFRSSQNQPTFRNIQIGGDWMDSSQPTLRNIQNDESCEEMCVRSRRECLASGDPMPVCMTEWNICRRRCPGPRWSQNQAAFRSPQECACCGQTL